MSDVKALLESLRDNELFNHQGARSRINTALDQLHRETAKASGVAVVVPASEPREEQHQAETMPKEDHYPDEANEIRKGRK